LGAGSILLEGFEKYLSKNICKPQDFEIPIAKRKKKKNLVV
jgi:hypothetical protein